jgi:hypothetical protein
MDESTTEPTLDDALISALARHYTDCEPAQTLAEALACLADACWTRAGETLNPDEDDPTARAVVLKALNYAVDATGGSQEFRVARSVFTAAQFHVPGASTDSLNQRLSRTYLLMANRLWDTWVSDPTHRCAECQRLADDETSVDCVRSRVYPYLREDDAARNDDGKPATLLVPNWKKTADAIVEGLRMLRAVGKLTYVPDRDAVRKALQRN